MDSIHTPNGSLVNVGEGYKASPDGMYLFGDGLSTLKWNPYKKIGGVDPSGMGGYEKCESLNTSGFTIGLDAITNINSFDNVVGIGSDGCFWYKRSKKTNVLTSGTSSNRVVPISKSFIGKSISHSANLITIGFSIEEVSTSIHENGMDSPETYMAIGGLAGNGISIWLCTTTGATAGSTFFGLGAIPGAVLGFFSGVLTNYFLEKGGRMIGKRYYEARH